MTTINSLYKPFGLSPDCTDDELRCAYRHAMLENHPDLNPNRVEVATAKTQDLTAVYAILKEYRESGIEPLGSDIREFWAARNGSMSADFSFTFGGVDIEDCVDIEDIACRKESFRQAWEAFRQHPSDVFQALRLVSAAFNAERQDAVYDLLRNPILIDAASFLLDSAENKSESVSAFETLLRWANVLYQNQLIQGSIQILEDAFSTGKSPPKVLEELRSVHYNFAQGYTSDLKPEPTLRIKHLNRILELGFEYGYIYKLIAEAYHEIGDDTQARVHLKRAYKLDPDLSGAVRISRTLGLLPAKQSGSPKRKNRAKYKYTRPEQIPSPSQIRKWATSESWNNILAFADLSHYSPRIISKSRRTVQQIVISLGDCNTPQVREILMNFLNSIYQWDVCKDSILSLVKVGDHHTLEQLQAFAPHYTLDEAFLRNAIPYLQARMANQMAIPTDITTEELMRHAEQAFSAHNYGQARFLFEKIVATIEQSHPLYFDIITLLARACAKMGDSSRAVQLVRPVFHMLSTDSQSKISKEIASWICYFDYDPANDQDYLLAIDIYLGYVLTSNNPDEILENLNSLMWEMVGLGKGDIVQWIRSLIRTKAPGTRYVDSRDCEQYVRDVELSEYLSSRLTAVYQRIKTSVPNKLNQVLQSPNDLTDSDPLLVVDDT